MIKLRQVHKVYTQAKLGFHALKEIDLYLEKGEIVTVFGPSGCGKTTLLNIIAGIDTPTSGEMVINSKLTTTFTEREWDYFRNHQIGFIFQQYNLIEHLPIIENIALSAKLSGVKNKEAKQKAIELLKQVGLENHLHKLPGELSGGERQRVAIARALINDPEIILADEPTGALDKKTGFEVMDLIKSICKDKLVIIVTHNKKVADRYSTRKIELKDGRVISDSAPKDKQVLIYKKRRINQKKLQFKESLRLALYNIKGKIWRTLLVSLGLSVGIVGLILIDSFFNSVRDGIEQESAILVNNPDLYVSAVYDEDLEIKQIQTDIESRDIFKEVLYFPDNQVLITKNISENYSTENPLYTNLIETPKSTELRDIFNDMATGSKFPTNNNEVLLSRYQAMNLVNTRVNLTKTELMERLEGDTIEVATRFNYLPEYYSIYGGLEIGTCEVLPMYSGNPVDVPAGYDPVKYGSITANLAALSEYREGPLSYSDTEEIYCEDYSKLDWRISYGEPLDVIELTIVGIHDNNLFDSLIVSDNVFDTLEYQKTFITSEETPYEQNFYRFRSFLKNSEVDNKVDHIISLEMDGYIVDENPDFGLSILGPIINFFMYIVQFIFSSIVSIAIVTGGLMLLLILFIGIIERKREIGLVRAMGGTRGDVRRIYSGETTIIGLIAGLMSIVLSIIIVAIANYYIFVNYKDDVLDWLPFINPRKVLTINYVKLIWAIVGALVIAFISGLAPSIRAGRKKPIEALRNE